MRQTALHTDYARATDGANYPGENSAEAFEVERPNELVSNLVALIQLFLLTRDRSRLERSHAGTDDAGGFESPPGVRRDRQTS